MKKIRTSKRFRKTVLSIVLSVILFAWFNPSTSMATGMEDVRVFTCDAAELERMHLAVGQINYNDDLCKGGVNVQPILDGSLYCVSIYQYYQINQNPKTAKGKAKQFEMTESKGMRERAQELGYWKCTYKMRSAGNKTVKSTSTFYKEPLSPDEAPKSIIVKVTSKRLSKRKATVRYDISVYGDAFEDMLYIVMQLRYTDSSELGYSISREVGSITVTR